jgi:hypothetical protein
MAAFRVDAPSFLAGAAATVGFFAADGFPVRLFFCMAGSSSFEFGPLSRCHSAVSSFFDQCTGAELLVN